MKTYAIILLSGKSERFLSKTTKQFALINDKPICYYAVLPLIHSSLIDEIIVVAKEQDFSKIKQFYSDFYKKISYITGGKTRFDSVDNAINFLSDIAQNDDNILIHDGVRLFLEEKQIQDLIESLKTYKASTLAIPFEDSFGQVVNNELTNVLDRSQFMRIQTPQAFKFKTIKKAHEIKNMNATDDCQLCLSIGEKVAIIQGSKNLMKITTIEDIDVIKAKLDKNGKL